MTGPDRLAGRACFDEVAELYDRVRPGYPTATIADLTELAGARAGARVLEIGCGTGQLTVPLVRLGCRLVALELGPRLAKIAAAKLACEKVGASGTAEVLLADFDRWPGQANSFDLVVTATAFHWLDPATRLARIAALLRPGGAVAVIATFHVAGGSTRFFAAARHLYRYWDPRTPPKVTLPAAEDIAFEYDLEHGGLFGPTVFRRYSWEVEYRTAEYLDLLRTYSNTLTMPPRTRHGLLHDIGALIDTRYQGRIVKRYQTELRVAACAE
ncbi:MAG TPA: class I SAM-dependent methyltransferase [Pseudonocardiaceae bacterium]|nr:class I SAM-dependent methyltransferase [Pseudonocardiaceae bacterium]